MRMLGRMAAPPLGLPARDPARESRVWTVSRVDTELDMLSAVTPWRRDTQWHTDVDQLLDIRLHLRNS